MDALIPRKILFGNPERTGLRLSPDGRWLAWLAPDARDVLQVWVREVKGTQERCVTRDPHRGIRSFFWTCRADELLYLQDADGDENFHVFHVQLRTAATRDLTPLPGVRAELVAVEPAVPESILVALNHRDKKVMDVYRLRLDAEGAEARTLAAENPGRVIGWVADGGLRIRAALAARPDGGHDVWWRERESDAWRTILSLSPDDQGAPLEFSEDGRSLYLLSSHSANAQRLIRFDAGADAFTTLFEDAVYDVSGVLFHPLRRTVLGVAVQRDKLVWQSLSPELTADLAYLSPQAAGNELHLAAGDLEGRLWTATIVSDREPARYFLYDRSTRTLQFIFSQNRKLEGLPLVPMQPVQIRARDGLTLHGYLTVPSAPPPPPAPPLASAPLRPAVLLVHGGPWARDRWQLHPTVQWLANRGYAVLQVNYRGSAGYGKAFLNAGNWEWAGKMHDDLLDSVKWLIDERIADPARIAIMGGSYGGYATLVGLTFTPDVFACGVDIVGPSNLKTLIDTIPPYWEPMKASFAKRVGPLDDDAFMAARSPLTHVDRIQRPLLIGQGANDPRVKQSESDQIVAAMRAKGLAVEYWIYRDEGHGFARPENRLHFYARVEAFLARHLGGEAEPFGDPAGHTGVQP